MKQKKRFISTQEYRRQILSSLKGVVSSPLSHAPVAYWPFDGDINDHSGNGHHFPAGAPTFTDGPFGQALSTGGGLIQPQNMVTWNTVIGPLSFVYQARRRLYYGSGSVAPYFYNPSGGGILCQFNTGPYCAYYFIEAAVGYINYTGAPPFGVWSSCGYSIGPDGFKFYWNGLLAFFQPTPVGLNGVNVISTDRFTVSLGSTAPALAEMALWNQVLPDSDFLKIGTAAGKLSTLFP